MKYAVFTSLLVVAALFAAASAFANPPCPESADRLGDYAACMRPFPNGRGQVLVGYASGGMDHHTAALMNSMHREVNMPQVYPSIPAAVSFASTMAVAATATFRLPHPYNYWMWSNPYLWMGMGMPIYPY